MDLDEYLHLVADRMKLAETRGDKAEVLRLLNLLADTIASAIRKLEGA